MRSKIELLAPAGSMEALVAAIQNGANAVYLGGKEYSARASANNFSREELTEAIYYAHFRNVSIYVTVNTILDEKELEESMEYIGFLNEIGVDGIIVQDLGLAKAIRENFNDLELHASTQMTINSLEGAKLLEKNGFKRVVLARETPLEEAKLIRENTNLDIEAFAHGALCISYSGQCYMSSMIGGRSGNRGRCAQPCRKSYEIIKPNKEVLNTKRAYLLSPMDLYTLENIDKIIDSGITSIKIEGRMKRPEYVATVVGAYRKAIDKKSIKGQERKLRQAFNRGFTKGIPFKAFSRELVDSSRPDNRGLEFGKVLNTNRSKTEIEIFDNINIGDILEFETIKGRKTFSSNLESNNGTVIFKLPFKVEENSQVRRIRNIKEFEESKETYLEDNFKMPISIEFYGKIGEFPRLIIYTKKTKVEVFKEEEVQSANKAPMDKEKILKQLEKLGDTSFYLKSSNIYIDDNIFLPVSTINSLRREGVEKLEKYFKDNNLRDSKKVNINKNPKSIVSNPIKLSVSLESKEQFHKINTNDISRFYLRFLDKEIYEKLLEEGKEVYFRTDKILFHDDFINLKRQLKNFRLSGIVADNLGSIEAFQEYKLIGDMGLNVFNSHSIDFLEKNGLNDVILSSELTMSQIQEIKRRTNATLESIGYGFLPVMTMKHCPFSLAKGCTNDRNCNLCNYKVGYYIRDEKNVDFKVKRQNDLSTIYNSYPISMIDYIKEIENSGIDYLLLDFSFEENIQEIIDEFIKAKNGKKSDLNNRLKDEWTNITYGHYFRGVE